MRSTGSHVCSQVDAKLFVLLPGSAHVLPVAGHGKSNCDVNWRKDLREDGVVTSLPQERATHERQRLPKHPGDLDEGVVDNEDLVQAHAYDPVEVDKSVDERGSVSRQKGLAKVDVEVMLAKEQSVFTQALPDA